MSLRHEVLTTDCYDNDPLYPWEFRFGRRRKPLTPDMMTLRATWAKNLLKEGLPAHWFLRNVIWIDLCSKIIPGTPQKAYDMTMAGKNKRPRLMSRDSLCNSENLGGSSTAEKQCRRFFCIGLRPNTLVSICLDTCTFPLPFTFIFFDVAPRAKVK